MQHQLHIQQHRGFSPSLSRKLPFRAHPVVTPAHGTATRRRHPSHRCSSANAAASVATTPPKQHLSSSGSSTETGANDAAAHRPESDPDTNSQQSKQFNWYKAWYPLAVLHNLDRDIPSHARVLGLDLVVWYDKNASKWRVFQDRCPHRLAPLSEGRIDNKTGNLYCNYHGWQFDGSGACTSIPQLAPGQPLNSKRSCATNYPSCEREGLLWIWPDSSPTATVDSSDPAVWPGLAPELDLQGATEAQLNKTWYFRDLQVPWLAAKENAFNDCSHDIVLHHGSTIFASRDNAAPIDMRLVDIHQSGYTVRETSGKFQDTARFPCGSRRDFPAFYAGVAYIVPTGVGTCRQFHCFVKPPLTTPDKPAVQQQQEQARQQQQQQEQGEGAPKVEPPKASNSNSSSSSSSKLTVSGPPLRGVILKVSRALSGLKPAWMLHMVGHLLVDADISMQSKVDVQRALDDRVYMPAAADAGPAAFVRWIREFGDQGPPVAKLNDPFLGHTPTSTLQRDRRQLLDRYWSHTASCKDCKAAYEQSKALRQVAGVVAVIAASAAVAAAALVVAGALPAAEVTGPSAHAVVSLLVKDARITAASWLGVAACAAGVVWAAVGRLIQSFEFIDYDKHHVSRV